MSFKVGYEGRKSHFRPARITGALGMYRSASSFHYKKGERKRKKRIESVIQLLPTVNHIKTLSFSLTHLGNGRIQGCLIFDIEADDDGVKKGGEQGPDRVLITVVRITLGRDILGLKSDLLTLQHEVHSPDRVTFLNLPWGQRLDL